MERIGHRGAPREVPENTVPSFKRAFERRADAVELDVHATRDGVVVVNHDPLIGAGYGDLRGVPIAELDWKDLARANLASASRIPMLTEVLAVSPAGATVYIEIKGAGIERAVAEVLADTTTRIAVHSFDHAAIGRLREIAPAIPRGILLDDAVPDLAATMTAVGARDVWPRWTLVDASLVATVRAAGGRVIPWTVNEVAPARALVGLGVDGICTDDVRLLDQL